MTDQASGLGLVHRIDHRGRRAGATERVADVDNFSAARAFAAKLLRHGDTEQALGARGGYRFVGKPRIAVDGRGVFGGNRGDPLGARQQIAGVGGAQIARRGENAARGSARRLNVLVDL